MNSLEKLKNQYTALQMQDHWESEDYKLCHLINEQIRILTEQYDDMIVEFLQNNGYDIKKPYTATELYKIKEELTKKDKFVDILEYTEFAEDCSKATTHFLPFLNSISNPISEDTRQHLIEEWKRRNNG